MITHQKRLDYFDTIDTEEKAYFLGLLYADGNTQHNRFSIRLKAQDKHILERFSQAIFGKIHLKEYKAGSSRMMENGKIRTITCSASWDLNVCSVSMADAVSRLGAFPKKSLTLRFPTRDQVPDHLLRHFIRGYFDGDGCISKNIHRKCRHDAVIIISSHVFCEEFSKRMRDILGVNFVNRRRNKISTSRVSGGKQVKTFMDWTHRDSTISLDRKRLRYEELLRHRENLPKKTSRYPYISLDKARGKWIAAADRKTYLGRYDSEEKAYTAQQAYLSTKVIDVS